MNSPADPTDPTNNVELRMRTIRTLWVAMVLTVVVYYLFTLFVGRPPNLEPNDKLFLLFAGVAAALALISFPIKSWLVNKAINQGQVQLVQQAYIVAFAITEVGGLLAIIDFFITNDRYYYVMLIIAGCGQLLHFPKREHVVNASFKRAGPSDIWQ